MYTKFDEQRLMRLAEKTEASINLSNNKDTAPLVTSGDVKVRPTMSADKHKVSSNTVHEHDELLKLNGWCDFEAAARLSGLICM